MSADDRSNETRKQTKREERADQPPGPPEGSKLDEAAKPEPADPASLSGMEASFWDESQIQAVVRHAGASGLSPQEFFNKKWKDILIHGKKASENDVLPSDPDEGAR